MKHESTAGIHLYYDPGEHEAARLIGPACEKSAALMQARWDLWTPADCRVYIMTSWIRFLFQSAPWPWKVYLALALPLVALRARSIWRYAGGWSLSYGHRRVVGVKPPRLLEKADRSLGEQIFVRDLDLSEKVQTIACHELAHAFTFHLKLPTWLQEGLATLAMEHYLGRQIVRDETLASLDGFARMNGLGGKEKLRVSQPQDFIASYARGYWLTRYLEETRPERLKELLTKRHSPQEFDRILGFVSEKGLNAAMAEIEQKLREHFRAA